MPTDKRLRALCERVMADPGTPLTFDALAREVGASTRTLARRFRDELGVNFRSGASRRCWPARSR